MIVIIGAGTAGLTARREIARHTEDYLIIDPGPHGTTCARVGCMPSKALIQIANDFHRRKKWKDVGIKGADQLEVDPDEVMNHVRKLRDKFTGGVLKGMDSFDKKILKKRATFIDSHTIDCEGQKIRFDKAIIATGSTPFIPSVWQMYPDAILTTDNFFEQKSLPKTLAVIGMGVIGVELGQALARLGIKVIAFGQKKSIGGATDPQINSSVFSVISNELHFVDEIATPTGRTPNGQLIIKAADQEYIVDKALLCVGRRPQVNLGLEKVGITLDEKGMPEFDPVTFSLKKAPHLYFVGDVNASRPLLHEAADQGFIAGQNAISSQGECFQKRTPLSITFSEPNIASVGLKYKDLVEKNLDFITGRSSLASLGRAITKLSPEGEMAIYIHPTSGLILGAEFFCADAEHLAHLMSLAISRKMNVFELLTMPFYHPVIEEALRSALRDAASQTQRAKTERIAELNRCSNTPT